MTADQLTVGSLCTGYGGLDLALKAHFNTRVIWTSEIDKHASRVVKARYRAPNLGDLKLIDWEAIEAPDIITAGYPCQPFSYAGGRNGTEDPRHIWPWIAEGVRHLRPRLIVLENVAGHLTKGFGEVVGTLAAMGYDATWGCVRASDAGGCHQRKRVFIVAADTDGVARAATLRSEGRPRPLAGQEQVQGVERLRGVEAPPHTHSTRPQGRRGPVTRTRELTVASRDSVNHASVKLLPTPRAQNGEARNQRPWVRPSHQPQNLENALAHCLVDWGEYQQAITRWGMVVGRDAPPPTTDGRLSPVFVEWMMGLPAGWVTAVTNYPKVNVSGEKLARSHMLKILGNGVVPQQAALALAHLLPLALAPPQQRPR